MAIFYHHNVCHYKISQYISNDKPNGNFLPFQVFAKIEKKIAFACCSNVTRLAGKSQKLAKLKLDTTADANLFLLLSSALQATQVIITFSEILLQYFTVCTCPQDKLNLRLRPDANLQSHGVDIFLTRLLLRLRCLTRS